MQFGINAIQKTTNIPGCMTMHELQQVTCQDQHMQCLKEYIIKGWTEHKDQIQQDIRPYWIFKDDMAVIMEGKHIVVTEVLQQQTLQQLHVNHISIEKKLNY